MVFDIMKQGGAARCPFHTSHEAWMASDALPLQVPVKQAYSVPRQVYREIPGLRRGMRPEQGYIEKTLGARI